MEHRDIYITEFDLNRLTELLEVGLTFRGSNSESRHLDELKRRIGPSSNRLTKGHSF